MKEQGTPVLFSYSEIELKCKYRCKNGKQKLSKIGFDIIVVTKTHTHTHTHTEW